MKMNKRETVVTHDSLMTQTEAAEFLRLSVRQLQLWRRRGCGPKFILLGKSVRYRKRDVEQFLSRQSVACEAAV
jgi:predicted site-specific integrase-resolvase